MKKRLDSLRQPTIQKEKAEKHVHFEFDTPTGATTTYPGLDGHPCRITPIPVSTPITPHPTPDEMAQRFREYDARMKPEILRRAAQMRAEEGQKGEI